MNDQPQDRPAGWGPSDPPTEPEPTPAEELTPEEAQARYVAAVNTAIAGVEEAARHLADVCDPGTILVEWLLVSAVHMEQPDGSSVTGYRLNGPPHETAAHRVVGLLTTALNLVPVPGAQQLGP